VAEREKADLLHPSILADGAHRLRHDPASALPEAREAGGTLAVWPIVTSLSSFRAMG